MKAALAAAEAGADAIGFVFAPSRRQVTPERAQALISALPAGVMTRVGVFVDAPAAEIRQTAAYAGLTHVQLHGNEPPEMLAELGLPVIKAFRVKDEADLARLPAYRQAAGLLLEPYVEGQAGGSGTSLNLNLFRQAAKVLAEAGVEVSGSDDPLLPGRPKLILAGGLSPENVTDAIFQAAPGGVDVSSGVETESEKDVNKIYQFVKLVRGATR